MRGIERLIMLVAAAIGLASSGGAQAPAALQPAAPRVTTIPSLAVPASAGTQPALAKGDVDAWLDGYLPYALKTGDVAGAAVVVVKDGEVLTERGYGYADVARRLPVDPRATLFRPGSISKLFTWTAVMQLVQAHKLDLDADINRYLDFRIPPAFGKPITLRDLMTHRPGFEENVKYLLSEDTRHVPSLADALKRRIPARVYAPGTIPAYSNYGASLAGYIVERVSHEPFATYVARHIFAPLGMTRSSFAQPLPPSLAAALSKGYETASRPAHAYEVVPVAPAGALSATADDMARFMVAHLDRGGALLSPATAAAMQRPDIRTIPGLPGMALGFYHEDRNGLVIVGHGGDTNLFHSDLHLYLDKGVGLYVSLNSSGKDGATHVLRDRLFADFTDRYFPHAEPSLPTAASAHAHGLAMAGQYISSRGSFTNWLRLLALVGQAKVTLNGDDTITVSSLTDAAGVAKRWREVGPWLWQDVGGDSRLAAKVDDGRVAAFAPDAFAPIFVFLPAPASLDAAWMVPALVAALGVLLISALAWPIRALVRHRYGHRPVLTARELWMGRAAAATGWVMLAIAGGWMLMVALLSGDVTNSDGGLDGLMRILQLLSLVAIVGVVATIANVVVVARRPGRSVAALLWAIVLALAATYMMWLIVSLHLSSFSLSY